MSAHQITFFFWDGLQNKIIKEAFDWNIPKTSNKNKSNDSKTVSVISMILQLYHENLQMYLQIHSV